MTSIIIGNGLNRVKSTFSWEDLLKELRNEIQKDDVVIFKNKPFPLIYEEICIRAKRYREIDESTLMKMISSKSLKIRSNSLYSRLYDLDIKHYITTNYDYAIERTENDEFYMKNNNEEMKRPEKE